MRVIIEAKDEHVQVLTTYIGEISLLLRRYEHRYGGHGFVGFRRSGIDFIAYYTKAGTLVMKEVMDDGKENSV